MNLRGVAICLLLGFPYRALGDNPCPMGPLPSRARVIPYVAITPAQIPKTIAESAHKLNPKDYLITIAHELQMSGEAVWFVSLANCCDGPAASWQNRIVAVEDVAGTPRAFLVQNADGSPAALVGFGAAYLRDNKLYIIFEYFSRGMCFEGVVSKIGTRYKYVPSPKK